MGIVRSVDLVVEWDGDLYKVVFHLRLRSDLTHMCVVFVILISISGRSVEFPNWSPYISDPTEPTTNSTNLDFATL